MNGRETDRMNARQREQTKNNRDKRQSEQMSGNDRVNKQTMDRQNKQTHERQTFN